VLFDSWYASKRLRKCCRRRDWQVLWAIKSHRTLDDKQLSQWPKALRHPRYQRVQRTATGGRQRTSLVCTLQGKLPKLPFAVCVLIRQRHPRDTHPKYFLCTDLSLSAQRILPIDPKRWPIAVDNFSVKQPWGVADVRVPSYEATEKWFAMVFVALAFLPWRLNHAQAEERWRSVADVGRPHRDEHVRTLLEMACQEAAQWTDYLPVFRRFLCQPT
jgi:hypothetical protein